MAQCLQNQSTRRVQPPLTGQAWLHGRGEAHVMACLLQELAACCTERTEPMIPRSRSSLTLPLGRRGSLWARCLLPTSTWRPASPARRSTPTTSTMSRSLPRTHDPAMRCDPIIGSGIATRYPCQRGFRLFDCRLTHQTHLLRCLVSLSPCIRKSIVTSMPHRDFMARIVA